ncbi:MAG: hypothetical protein HYX86_01505 [Chloroflexi bacterium]|nr:hypothetical protein [Chloroflexota bacterium]
MSEPTPRIIDVEMSFDARPISPQEKELLKSLLEASDLIDKAFRRQMGIGPGDEPQEEMRPALYPLDLTREEFEDYIAGHPAEREALVSPYTVVRRQGKSLQAVPYHEEYREFMGPAADALLKAADFSDNPSLQKFLRSRAQALLRDDYYQSDVDWINLEDNPWDITIGPYEVYRDGLLGLKGFYMSVIEKVDMPESKNLEVYLQFLDQLEEELPYPPEQKPQGVKLNTAFAVVQDIHRAGDILYGYQAVAQNLPNDPRVLSEYGSKKTFYKNMFDLRSERLAKPLVQELIAEDQTPLFDAKFYFQGVLFHEIAHALGPRYAVRNGERLELHETLKDRHAAFEEGKADVVGYFGEDFLVRQGFFPQPQAAGHAVAYLASKLRSIRFGMKEAHGLGAMCQLNHHMQSGVISLDENRGRFRVDAPGLGNSIRRLAERMLNLQARGDYNGVGEFYVELGHPTPQIEKAMTRVSHIPVDVKPHYRIIWA